MTNDPDLLWSPGPDQAQNSNVALFLRWLERTRGLRLDGYAELWRWSTTDLDGFWSAVWEFYGLDTVSGYDRVLADATMPGAAWFPGARVNFAERCLAQATTERPAFVSVDEGGVPVQTSWEELGRQVASVARALRGMGVVAGDCVAGYLPNLPQAVVALLATASLGAVWTVCSPDFGTPSVLARLRQARPTVLVAADGYRWGGKQFDRRTEVAEIAAGLPTLRHLLAVDNLFTAGEQPWAPDRPDLVQLAWSALPEADGPPHFAEVPFDHPLWILWSSGTTGVPKGIVQGHGGITVELLKALGLGADLRAGDRFLFVTSTSWMVWNFLVGGLLHGSTVILYDGSPTYPDVDGAWRIAERTAATVVGLGAAYLAAGEKADAHPADRLDLTRLRTVLQTGSSLAPSTWRWAHDRFPGVWLQSICGGTDVCSALAGGSALLPVRLGRIQAPALGVALAAWDPAGRALTGEQGELVVTAPLPSMPLRFVQDPDGARYRASYFDTYPGVWRHGDWVTVHGDLSVEVSGRSDSTLNRMGVRMGSADVYAVVEQLPEIADSLVLGVELPDGGYWMPLFVVTWDDELDDALRVRIRTAIRAGLSPRHVPDDIVCVAAVPRTLTGKKLEVPVKRILQGASPASVSSPGAVLHPEMLTWFADYAASRRPGGAAPSAQALLSAGGSS